jgi:beta-lactamase class A
MLSDLADPGIHHKFVAAIERRAPRARIFRKSGTWRNWHADSVLVRGPNWRNYILVALVESSNGETILRELVPAAETVLQHRPGL